MPGAHLHCDEFKVRWTRPAEDQDHERPPKAVLQELFREHGVHYASVLTPADILAASDYQRLCEVCPTSLGRLVKWLLSIGA